MIGKLTEAPFIGFDKLAPAGLDDTFEPFDGLFLDRFAEVRTKDKNSFVAPHRAQTSLRIQAPTSRSKEAGAMVSIASGWNKPAHPSNEARTSDLDVFSANSDELHELQDC